MATLLLFRHGNTFEAGAVPVRVGARTDLPLTAKGESQAAAAADFVKMGGRPVGIVKAGPLQRTRRMAEIIAVPLGMTVEEDPRLREIDYGLWEGLSDEAIAEKFGPEALDAWEYEGIWPEAAAWTPAREEIEAQLRAFLEEEHAALCAEDKDRVAVTSNGILRLLHPLVATQPVNWPETKVKTGHFCALAPRGAIWGIETWNMAPP